MRITGSMLTSNLLGNLYGNLRSLSKYQNQISANRRILRLSDDPIGVVSSIQIENDINRNSQYMKNVSDAQAWLNETESVLSDMNSVILRAKELSVQAGNGTYTEEQRNTIMQEIKELKQHYVDLANTKYSGKYIFGGYNTTAQPFTVSGSTISYNSIADLSAALPAEIAAESSQVKQFMLSPSMTFDVSFNGIQVMGTGEDNIFNIFEGFITQLNTADPTPELADYAGKFTDAQEKILALISEVGGRQSRLELVSERYDTEELNLNNLYTKIAGIDQAEVIMQYKMAEYTYNSALSVGAQIIQMSLVDFLR